MLPRLGLEPAPLDFRSGVLSSTPLGQGGKCSSMGREQSSLQYPAMLAGGHPQCLTKGGKSTLSATYTCPPRDRLRPVWPHCTKRNWWVRDQVLLKQEYNHRLRKPLLLAPPILWWSQLRVSQLSRGVPLVSFYSTTFWKRMLPRPELEPMSPDFRSSMLYNTPLGQGGKCGSMGGEQSSLQYPTMLAGGGLVAWKKWDNQTNKQTLQR